MPAAVTEKLAVWPAVTVALAGCVVMLGGDWTVRVAVLLGVLPAALLTTTRKVEALSVAVVGGVV